MSAPSATFEAVFTEFRPRILRYLQRRVGAAEAEDLAQEVFVKVDRSLHAFRGESSLATWIYRIAANTAVDHLRLTPPLTGPAEAAVPADNASPHSTAGAAPGRDDLPDSQLMSRDTSSCIRGLVDRLAEPYRIPLILSDLEGRSNAEIAARLGISLGSVKIRLHRARIYLRRELERSCVLGRDGRAGLTCDRRASAPVAHPRLSDPNGSRRRGDGDDPDAPATRLVSRGAPNTKG